MKKIIVLFLIIFISQSVFSQSKEVTTTSTSEVIYNAPSNPVVEQIVKNIHKARVNGDITNQRYWEGKLNEITKPQVLGGNPNMFKVIKNNEQQSPVEALNVTTLTTSPIEANSISRERVTGHIYAVVGIYGGFNSDTLKVYISTNNGLNFNLIKTISAPNFVITENGLDVEAVSKGDSSYAFISMDHTFASIRSTDIIRVRQDGGMYGSVGILGVSTNRYFNGRVTSDNATYTTSAYVYLTVTVDSLIGSTKILKQKLFKSTAPFAYNFSLTTCYRTPVGGFYGYTSGPVPDSAKMESDIAYVNTTGFVDQLYTVTIVRGIPGVYGGGTYLNFTRSNDFGSTAPTTFFTIPDDKLKEKPKFAATGYLNNSVMLVTRRLYGGGDWDPFYYYSSDITFLSPIFTSGYVESSNDTTIGVSVAALYRSNNTYLFAFNNRRSSTSAAVYTAKFNGGFLAPFVQANPSGIPGTTIYGNPDAGFRNVNNDSCLVIWGRNAGVGTYVTGGCSGAFTGIGSNNSLADGYSLSQNYPNPFNPSTVINFTLPLKSFVTIKVYDVNGKEISELINAEKQAGENSIEFNGANLSSGVYYYKLTAADFSQVRKMILVK